MKYPGTESAVLEFKREIPENEQIIKTIIGFCNNKGGKIILGVDDDGTIVGIKQTEAEQLMEYIEKAVFDASFPPILTQSYLQSIADKTILFIEVAQGMHKPYYLKKEGPEHGVYLRLGRSTIRATSDLIEELKWESRNISFDTMPVYQATEEDLDIVKFQNFLVNRKSARDDKSVHTPVHEAMIAYKIITKEHNHYYPTVCGILLFGKNPQFFFSEARIMCNHFSGNEIDSKVIASKECMGTLDEQFETAFSFVVNQLNITWEIIGTKRHEQLEIPKQAVREIIMNAVIHRNYHSPGPNKIAIFGNRVEIFSQGSFAGPIDQNIRAGFTALRNFAICKIFRELGLIENFGNGFITTFSSYQAANLKEPTVIEGTNFVKCILPRRTPDNMITRSKSSELTNELEQIMRLFATINEITVADVIHVLHFTRPTATRRLAELVKKGIITKLGKGRGIRYIKR